MGRIIGTDIRVTLEVGAFVWQPEDTHSFESQFKAIMDMTQGPAAGLRPYISEEAMKHATEALGKALAEMEQQMVNFNEHGVECRIIKME